MPEDAASGEYIFGFELVLARTREPLNPEGFSVRAMLPRLVVGAEPETINADGSSTSRITACVADPEGATIGDANDSITITNGSDAESAVTTTRSASADAVEGCAFFTLTSSGRAGTDAFTVHDDSRAIPDATVRVAAAATTVTISVEVAEDINGNGTRDAGEGLTNAARIDVYPVFGELRGEAVSSAVNSPNLTVTGVAAGTYDVVATNAAGFISTNAVAGTNATKVDNDTLRMTLAAGQTGTGTFLDRRVTRVAYVHGTDVAAGDAVAALLTPRGFQVDLVTMTLAESHDFTSYRAIVIGHDTGDLSSWGTPTAVANINRSGVPTVGMGEGGYAFFGKLGLQSVGRAAGTAVVPRAS